jgi:hypothetical protein
LFSALLHSDAEAAVSAIAQLRAAGHVYGTSYYCSALAEIELNNDQVTAASAHVERGIAYSNASGERFWFPRLLRQRAIVSHRLARPRSCIVADLDQAIAEAKQRGMLMFELEAQLVYSTLSFEMPSAQWDSAGLYLSQGTVLKTLDSLRSGNTDQQLAATKTASAEHV